MNVFLTESERTFFDEFRIRIHTYYPQYICLPMRFAKLTDWHVDKPFSCDEYLAFENVAKKIFHDVATSNNLLEFERWSIKVVTYDPDSIMRPVTLVAVTPEGVCYDAVTILRGRGPKPCAVTPIVNTSVSS